MKILFAGTPEFALQPLNALYRAGHEIVVLTQPDRPQGRKRILTPPPVKTEAEKLGLRVIQPDVLHADELLKIGAEIMVTCAYGQILTQEILDVFPKGVWNVHASLLPAYRGAAPIARAIMNGEEKTGVTIMKTDVGLDTGDIFLSAEEKISENFETCGQLSGYLSELGAKLIVQAVEKIAVGDVTLKKQGEGFTCKKVYRTEVDFSKGCEEVSRLINGLSPAPLAYARLNGKLMNFYRAGAMRDILWEENYAFTHGPEPCGTVLYAEPKGGFLIKCNDGYVEIREAQWEGGRRLTAKEILNGGKIKKGMCFDKPVL